MFLSIVMVFGLMAGVGTPRVMAAYETEIIGVEFETLYDGDTLWDGALCLNMLSNATAKYFIYDKVTWPAGTTPYPGCDYSYTKPTWSVTPSDVVQIHQIYTDYEESGGRHDSGISLSPLKKGTATLTWTTGKVTKTLPINVVDVLATSVTVSQSSVSFGNVGEQCQLTASVTPATASQQVIWETEDPKVATVDDTGKVTAAGSGTCNIIATATGGKKAITKYVKVNVVLEGDASPVYGTGTYPSNMDLVKGEAKYAPFDHFYADSAKTVHNKASDFTYRSLNPNVATVDSTGKITGVSEGYAQVGMTPVNKAGLVYSELMIDVYVTEEASLTGVRSVTVTPASLSLEVGRQGMLEVYVDADDPAKQLSTVTSSDSSVAKVGVDARTIIGVAPGTATITATSDTDPTKYAVCTVTVTQKKEVTGITLNKPAVTLEAGQKETLTATVTASGDGVDKSLSWSSSAPSVASVDSAGTITAVAPGTATITAASVSNAKVTAVCTVTVTAKKVPVTSVTLQPNSISLDARDNNNKTATLTAAVLPADATDKSLTWTSSNKSVATVANGVVTAVGGGTATITATANDGSGCSSVCTVTVVTPVKGITLSKSNLTLDKNMTAAVTANVAPENASNQTITAQSKNTDIATVSKNADGSYTIKGVATGNTDIVFTAADNGITASCTVAVNPTKVNAITLSDASGTAIGDQLNLTIGDTRQLSAEVSPSDADNKNVIWESSNTDVLTVSADGLLTARATGTAELRVIPQDGSDAKKVVTVKINPKYVSQIAVSAKDNKTTLKKGETLQLSAAITPADATNKNLIWSSSNPNLVTVRADGMVEVIADKTTNQTVTITAAAQDGSSVNGSIQLIVAPTPVESFTISGGSVGVQKTLQLQMMSFTPQTATNPTIVSWASSNTDIASVSDTGMVTGKAAGAADITATCADGKTATAVVTVVSNIVEVTEFTVESSKTLTVGENCTVTATVQPDNATNKNLTWTITEGQDVIVINDKTDTSAPVFAAKKAGTATIEVKSASNPALSAKTVTIIVLPKYVTEIQITADKTGVIKQGGTVQLTAEITPADATCQGVTWSSSDSNLATVDAVTGEVKIQTTGSQNPATVEITATANDGSENHTAVSKTYTIQIAGQQAATVIVSGVQISGESTRNLKTDSPAFTVSANVTPADATDQTLSWEIMEGASAVSISSSGADCTVTPVSAGTAKIKVSSVSNPAASAILVVNVTENEVHEHTYTDEITRQATCTQTGEITHTCACGDVRTETVPALGHSYTEKVVAPTTESQGYTRHTCSRCNSYYDDNYVPKLNPVTPEPTTEGPTTEGPTTEEATTQEPVTEEPKKGESVTVGGATYQVSSTGSKKTVTYVHGSKTASTIKIPSTVKLGNASYSVSTIADGAFSGYSKLTKVTIPTSVTKIGKNAFKNCTSLKGVTIPKNVTEIGTNAFAGCKMLKTVTFKGTKLKKIGQGAFAKCSSLKSVTISKSVTEIGKEAFKDCKKLSKITIKGTAIKKIGKNAFKNIAKKPVIKVPKKMKAAYKRLLKKAGYTKTVK